MSMRVGWPVSDLRRNLGLLLAVVGLVVAQALVASAQQDASIIGVIVDESGAVLPGVTITAASPALQVKEVAVVSNEHGEYRISPLPIGTYTVTYTLSGFQSARQENIRLTVGFSAKLDPERAILNCKVTTTGPLPITIKSANGAVLFTDTLTVVPPQVTAWRCSRTRPGRRLATWRRA